MHTSGVLLMWWAWWQAEDSDTVSAVIILGQMVVVIALVVVLWWLLRRDRRQLLWERERHQLELAEAATQADRLALAGTVDPGTAGLLVVRPAFDFTQGGKVADPRGDLASRVAARPVVIEREGVE